MAPVQTSVILTASDFDVIQNRVAVSLAKRERLIKSWTTSSTRPRPPPKTQEELDLEDADLFNPIPAGLGLGAPIPKEFFDGDVKRKEISSNDKLRHLILGNRAGLQGSKPRDGKEKAASAKRSLEEASSDDDQGRSALGKAKKSKNGNGQDTMKSPSTDGVELESKQGIISTPQENLTMDPSHVSHPETKPQVKRTETLHEMPSLQNAVPSLQQAISSLQGVKAKPGSKRELLVDYPSDDESDCREIIPINAASQMEQNGKSNISTISSSSTKATFGLTPGCGKSYKADARRDSKSTTPPIAKGVSSKGIAEAEKYLPRDARAPQNGQSSKSGSSYSSKSHASSTDSEPSDMETVIPLSLTSDVIDRTPILAHDRSMSVIEAKKARKRDKRARKKERDQQRKVLALGITSGGAEKSVIASTAGTGVAKKIKDRLLDANGN